MKAKLQSDSFAAFTAPEATPADPSAELALKTQVATVNGPDDGIVYITDVFDGEVWQGSGVLIAPDEVLTASHVVWHEDSGLATDIIVQSAYVPGDVGVTAVHYNPVDDTNDELTLAASQSDYAVLHLAQPIYGTTFGLTSNYGGGSVTISGYPGSANGTQVDTPEQVVLHPYYTILEGPGLGAGSSGGPVWITGGDVAPYVVGVVSTGNADLYGYNAQISQTAYDQIQGWLSLDGEQGSGLGILDTSLNQESNPSAVPYVGPVAGLASQYINITSDNLNATASTPNWFIHTGSGEDAIGAASGTNVLDGGTGSNFLVGGTGTDTFFTDDRAATSPIWDTLVNFHAGDAATLFGVTQAGFTLDWVADEGAAGYTGLTLHATEAGKPEASVTLAGFGLDALSNGQLTLSFGVTGDSPYLYIYANR